MIFSPRYAPHTAIVVAFALVPTMLHTYGRSDAADGLSATAVTPVLAAMPSTPTPRKAAQVKNRFDSDDWIERVYHAGQEDVVLFVGRSYDAKRLYHHPEIALGVPGAPAGILRATGRPDIPLHVLTRQNSGRSGLVVYTLLYGSRFIENPVAFQLRTSAESLVHGRKPMTLFFASDLSGDPSDIDRAPATQVLLAAVAVFQAAGQSGALPQNTQPRE